MDVTFDEELDILLGRSKGRAPKAGKVGGGGKRPRRYPAGAPEVKQYGDDPAVWLPKFHAIRKGEAL